MVVKGVPAACMVLRAVLMVITCLSMKQLDLRYRGDEVIWLICCFCMNLAKSSDEKGGLLLFEGPILQD